MLGAQWKHSYYGQKEWTHRLQWQSACFVIWMMKLMYRSLACAEQPQSLHPMMNCFNTLGYWKDRSTKDLISTPPFHFLCFLFWQISNKLYCSSFCSLLSSLFFHLQTRFFCQTFNEVKGMQDCTGNTWQSTFERLGLTNSTAVLSCLCLSTLFLSLHLSTWAGGCVDEHCNRGKIKIGCELGWRLVCGQKMEAENTGEENEQWGEGHQ